METYDGEVVFCGQCMALIERGALRCHACNAKFAGKNRVRRMTPCVSYGGKPFTLDEETMELDASGVSLTFGIRPDDADEDEG